MKGLTQTGMVIGTPEYMSPEQVLGKRGMEIDGRSDLYSLGIVMYRMLTGELPFQAETTVEMILQQLNTPPIAASPVETGIGHSRSRFRNRDEERWKRIARSAIPPELRWLPRSRGLAPPPLPPPAK